MEYNVSSLMALISHIHTLSADFTNRMLAEKGDFVSSHGYILYILSQKEKMSMGEIAANINRNKSTTTSLIRKLKEDGLIQDENAKEDGRSKLVSLTEKGKRYNELTARISDNLLATCYKDFSETEKQELLRLLVKLSENLECVAHN